jgi:hypothetical protein
VQARIEAQGRGSGDPMIEIRDESGAVVASDDDSGGSGAARSEIDLEAGRYCVSMRSYDGAPMTGFVRVGRTEHEALTAGTEVATDPAQPADPMEPADPMTTDPMAPATMPGGTCDAAAITAYLSDAPLDAQIAAGSVSQTATVGEVPYWGFVLAAPTTLSITAENEARTPPSRSTTSSAPT